VGRAVLRQRDPNSAGTKSSSAARPKSLALWVWSAFALLLTLSAVPVFSTVLPPLVDYPNHLARMHLLVEGGDAFYTVHWAVLPNLAEDLIVPPLARVLPLDIAAKLFLVMIFALMAGGTIWLNRVATGGWRPWPLLGFFFLYNRIFLWGFINYLFGIGVALGGTALWLALERRRWWLRMPLSSLVAFACFLSHIAAFGIYALVVLGIEALPAIAEFRTRQWPALGRRIVIAAPQFVAPAALLLSVRRDLPSEMVSYARLWRKADLLFSVFDNYDRGFDLACFALVLALIGGLVWTRRLGMGPRLVSATGIVFAAYLLLPSQMYGGSGADHRLPIAFFLLLVGASAPRLASRRIATAVGVVTASILIIRLGVIEHVWREADRIYSADLGGIDALPRGSKLAIVHPADLFHVVPVPEVHLAVLAIPRREAFVPSLFAIPGQQPVALKPAFAALAEAAQPQRLWAILVGGNAAGWEPLPAALEQYDFVAFTDKSPIHLPSSRCLAPFFVQPTFQIFAITHDLDCAGSAG
jgi:hypothetical protein